MQVTLLHATPLVLAAHSCRMSHDNHELSDSLNTIDCGPKDAALIERVGNKLKHASILEMLTYTFDIDHISRACLQELARHRHQSLTVKSSRYTLAKKLKSEPHFLNGWCLSDSFEDTDFNDDGYERASKYLVYTGNFAVDLAAIGALDNLRDLLNLGISNDVAKYALPEAFATRLQSQFNARSLQNFLQLRSSKDALPEIRQLALAIYDVLPPDHQYLFTPFIGASNATN